jgi:Icc-related predicted phosphoesterase
MSLCFFVSDLHGKIDRYQKLITAIRQEKPAAIFFGGDLLPSGVVTSIMGREIKDFIADFLVPEFLNLKRQMNEAYPRIFLILGNDDGKNNEKQVMRGVKAGVWEYVHDRYVSFGRFSVYGYSYIPPTPFLLKDWERYDVSRYIDPGCIPPEAGWQTTTPELNQIAHATIKKDIENLIGNTDLSQAIFLFHAPPYQTKLDRADLDGRKIDHVPVDVHVGSIAIKRFIKEKQPLLTLHGHIHESARITGSWKDRIGNTFCFSSAHDGPELALVRFDPTQPENATRTLL